jgi:predicted dehydrogenase
MSMQTCALVGCGAIAREHLRALKGLGIDIIAVCDISPARAEATAERYGVKKWYSNLEDMLRHFRPDLVHITTPPSSHFSIASSCLNAGLNVLCEKPITVSYSEFSELKALARNNNCFLMENQQNRFHSSIKRIKGLSETGQLGDILEVQICVSLYVFGTGSAYVDRNVRHFSLDLRGGVIEDFLPHMAYLAFIFTGPISGLRTVWLQHAADSPLPADEFRGLIKGEKATAYVSFNGNARPDGFLVRVIGTRMRVEANLFEPPRLTIKRFRGGEPAISTLVDGIGESRDILWGTIGSFWRKLGGRTSYDGLQELLSRTYRALELREPQPIPLEEIDQLAQLIDRLTSSEFAL